jgi:PPOX class probable F420-dependent enzyme
MTTAATERRFGMMALGLLLLTVVVAAVAHAGLDPTVVDALKGSKNIYVATKRADGTLSKVVPVWFMFDGAALYFATDPHSHKAKRIAKGSPLHVWVGRADGPHFVGRASLVKDPEQAARMAPVYNQKYWIAWLGFFRPDPERVRSGKTVLVKVEPPA